MSVSGLFNPLHFRRVGAVGTYGGGGEEAREWGGCTCRVRLTLPDDDDPAMDRACPQPNVNTTRIQLNS